jgi:hypothetical protein
MGKGKGAPDHWVAVVRPGKILFEMEGVTPELAREAMRLAAHKLPLKTSFVQRPNVTTVAAAKYARLRQQTSSLSRCAGAGAKREEQWNSRRSVPLTMKS